MPIPTPRDPVSQGRETDLRLTLLERRLAATGVPERLGPTGQEVADWDEAAAVGFYWSSSSATNGPVAQALVGVVESDGAGNVIQTVHRSDSGLARDQLPGWRRRSGDSGASWAAWQEINSSDGLPGPLWALGPSASSLTGGASSWQLIADTAITYRPPSRDLWVDVQAQAIMKASSGYSMLGINITGGCTVAPDESPDNSGTTPHWTPFTSSEVDTSVSTPTKRLLLPAGVDTNFMVYARRNVSSGTHTCNYSSLTLLPVRWGR